MLREKVERPEMDIRKKTGDGYRLSFFVRNPPVSGRMPFLGSLSVNSGYR